MNQKNGFRIGELEIRRPIVQGGMGVGVSLSSLASAVAREGGLGVISTAQIGFRDPEFSKDPLGCNLKAVKSEIAKARENANGGVLGVNIMVATRQYEEYVKAAVEAGIDIIISGAGMPMDLPKLVEGSRTKIAPIISTVKALDILCRYWKKKFDRLPDAVVIEGPRAGGHLGFSKEDIDTLTQEQYDEEIKKIIEYVREKIDDVTQQKLNQASVNDKITDENTEEITCKTAGKETPVIIAGGIFEKSDVEHYLSMGASAVQMATRFVTTEECDASPIYKQAYINAKKEDIVIVKSPVGMPGRAIHNTFLDKVADGERFMRGCRQCIKSCNPATAPYCITEALINAVEGRLDEGLIFCGSNAYRCEKIETVHDIFEDVLA